MTNTGLSKLSLTLLDRLTDLDPVTVPKLFQRLLTGICGSRPIYPFYQWKYARQWKKREAPKKILLIVDVCIGDAVLGAQMLRVIEDRFPNSELHYVCNRTGGELIDGMPRVHVHPIIKGERGFPTEEDFRLLRGLLALESFSVILNMSPFIPRKWLLRRGTEVLQFYMPFAAYVLRAWQQRGMRHVSYLARTFVADFLDYLDMRSPESAHRESLLRESAINQSTPAKYMPLNTNTVYLSKHAIRTAQAFLDAHGLKSEQGLLFFNPDATSQYGQIPFEVQSQILQRAAAMPHIGAVLLGKAYSVPGIEQKLIAAIPEPVRDKVIVVPHLPIEAYVAIMDACEMFVSGDTGPLHIAACWKASSDREIKMRNRTAVLAIYGATDSRMYGYDSFQPHHAPAAQNAPSRSVSAPASCRNISCINKFGKHCSTVRCFNGLPTDEIINYISDYFRGLGPSARDERPLTIALKQDRVLAL